MSFCHKDEKMKILATFKRGVLPSSKTSKAMGQWSSGYNDVLIAKIFDEKIDENLSDIFHGLTKNFLFSFFKIPKIF